MTGRTSPPGAADPAPPARRWPQVRAAVTDVAGVGPGMAVLGVSFGLVVVASGLPWWWTPVFSGLIYAGSLEFLLVPLALAATPLPTIALTALLVNARHVFYGLSFPLHRVRSRLARGYAVFALIDEAYALLATRDVTMTGTRIVTTQILLQACWVGGGVVGGVAGRGSGVPVPGLDFVFVALFLVLALDAIRSGRDPVTPLLALAAALLARWLVPGQMLLLAMGVVVAGLLVRSRLAGTGRTGDA